MQVKDASCGGGGEQELSFCAMPVENPVCQPEDREIETAYIENPPDRGDFESRVNHPYDGDEEDSSGNEERWFTQEGHEGNGKHQAEEGDFLRAVYRVA